MKIKKKVKVILTIILILLFILLGFLIYKNFFKKETPKEAKVISSIKDYGYSLKDNKSSTYKEMFHELEKILEKEKVDKDEYAKKITEMFIYDFYTLDDKAAKNDIGGVDFVHPSALTNFLENAESTYYKYVESNIYGNRKQGLPTVDRESIKIVDVTNGTFAVDNVNDDQAYFINVTWDYTDEAFSDYQKSATVVLANAFNKLYIVELK